MRIRYNSAGFAVDGVIFTGLGDLWLFSGFNPTANQGWVQLFDLAAVPGAGAAPIQSLLVPSLGTFSFVPSPIRAPYAAGCVWAISTSGDVLAPSADAWWVYAEAEGP